MVSNGRTGRPWERAKAWVKANATHCNKCGQPLTDYPWPHPMSTTVDHITPLILGGDPLDHKNLAGCHLSCNSADGARLTNRHRATGSYVEQAAPYESFDW